MLQKITEKELRMQEALGSLPEEYRNELCRHKTPSVSKGTRKCNLCGMRCIKAGEEYYNVTKKYQADYLNICKTCSWLTIQTINRMIVEYNNKSK